jgi:hypothetical protein
VSFNPDRVPFNPDIIWASPPCTTFSVASISTHWKGGKEAYVPKTEKAELGIELVKKTIDIIKHYKPKYWYIENPRGVLRKLIEPWLNESLGNFWKRETVTYCQYGDTRMKPTDIWTNDFNWKPKPMCKNGDKCHQSAPRGSKTGTQGLKGSYSRSIVPAKLCNEILESKSGGITPAKKVTTDTATYTKEEAERSRL